MKYKHTSGIFTKENLQQIPNHLNIPAGLVLGFSAGIVLDKFLKKIFKTSSVQGIMGVEMAEQTAKFVIPAIEIGGGILGYIVCNQRQVNEIIKYASIGVAGYGALQLYRNVVNPQYLRGFSFEGLDDVPQLSSTMLNLPELNGSIYEEPMGALPPSFEGYVPANQFEGSEVDMPMLNVSGFQGDDEVAGFEGDDDINGFSGDDDINGLEGEDDMNGFEGNDDFTVGATEFE
jgi:hypothetical protein